MTTYTYYTTAAANGKWKMEMPRRAESGGNGTTPPAPEHHYDSSTWHNTPTTTCRHSPFFWTTTMITILRRPCTNSPLQWLLFTDCRCILFLLILVISFPSTIVCSAQPPLSSASIPQPQHQQQHQRQQHPPRCIAADSYHTYICTENSDATRRALRLFASNGSDDDYRMDDSTTLNSSSSSSITSNKNTLLTTTTTTTASSHENHMDLGVEQRITGSDTEQSNTRTILEKMHVYLEEEVYSRSEYEIVRMNGKWYDFLISLSLSISSFSLVNL